MTKGCIRMDENNNVNQETGFVLNNNSAAAGSQQDASGQADQTVWQQGAQSQTTGRRTHSSPRQTRDRHGPSRRRCHPATTHIVFRM